MNMDLPEVSSIEASLQIRTQDKMRTGMVALTVYAFKNMLKNSHEHT